MMPRKKPQLEQVDLLSGIRRMIDHLVDTCPQPHSESVYYVAGVANLLRDAGVWTDECATSVKTYFCCCVMGSYQEKVMALAEKYPFPVLFDQLLRHVLNPSSYLCANQLLTEGDRKAINAFVMEVHGQKRDRWYDLDDEAQALLMIPFPQVSNEDDDR